MAEPFDSINTLRTSLDTAIASGDIPGARTYALRLLAQYATVPDMANKDGESMRWSRDALNDLIASLDSGGITGTVAETTNNVGAGITLSKLKWEAFD